MWTLRIENGGLVLDTATEAGIPLVYGANVAANSEQALVLELQRTGFVATAGRVRKLVFERN